MGSHGTFVNLVSKFMKVLRVKQLTPLEQEQNNKYCRDSPRGCPKESNKLKVIEKRKNMKKALITGITGQDGSYLAEFLLEKGYEVHGIKRRSSSFNTDRIDHLYHDLHEEDLRFFLHYGDLTDSTNLIRLIQKIQPDEIYNLGAQSHVQVSFDTPEYTANSDALGTLRILEAIRLLNLEKKVKFYQASTSELYGKVQEIPQSETTPFYPRSPYAVAKLYAYWITVNYREAYNIFASNGILFNHESPRRGETFVTRKITRSVSRIMLGIDQCLYLGNMDAKRDWVHAKDYIEGMWMVLQHTKPDDFVMASGETHTVREFVELAFFEAGIGIEWSGDGLEETGCIRSLENKKAESLKIGDIIVRIDPRYFRPTEVELLLGDPSKIENQLGWKCKISFKELIKEMVQKDIELAKKMIYLEKGGFSVSNRINE